MGNAMDDMAKALCEIILDKIRGSISTYSVDDDLYVDIAQDSFKFHFTCYKFTEEASQKGVQPIADKILGAYRKYILNRYFQQQRTA